jgi:Ni/Co efflux regulator RcnB
VNRRFLCASALSLFVVPASALAQPPEKHGGGGAGRGHGGQGGPAGGGHGHGGGPPGGGAPHGHGPVGGGHEARAVSHAPAMGHERAPVHERAIAVHEPRVGRHERAAGFERGGPTRRFASRGRERLAPALGPYRPGQARPASFRPIRARPYRYPSGWRYRRWSVGAVLPALFLTSVYIYDDYWRLGLPGPPYGYVWVRYGPDLLLVDRFTGRIVDVIYGAFFY